MIDTKNIKAIRSSFNKNQEETAKLLKVSRSSYAMWESNNNIFPIKRLIDFCIIFNTTLDFALSLTSKQNPNSNPINKEKLKERLKEFRKENKLTQEKICQFLHIDQPTWSIYENGKSIIGTPFIYMICSKYKISADYLLGRTDKPKYLK